MSDDRHWRSALKPEQYAHLTEITAGRDREWGYFVILGIQWELPSADIIQTFAQGLGFDPYMARQRLLAPCPRVLRREEHRTKAEEWVAWLTDLGLSAFAVSEERVAAFEPWSAVSVHDFRDELCFVHENESTRRFPKADVQCLVIGRVQRRTTQHTAGANVVSFLQPGTSDILQSAVEGVIDIHSREGSEPVRLLENTLKFANMPLEQTDNRARMRQMIDFLAAAASDAPVIDDFSRASAFLGESCQIVRRSIDLAYRPAGSPVPHMGLAHNKTIEESDAVTFDLYSLLSALQLQRG